MKPEPVLANTIFVLDSFLVVPTEKRDIAPLKIHITSRKKKKRKKNETKKKRIADDAFDPCPVKRELFEKFACLSKRQEEMFVVSII